VADLGNIPSDGGMGGAITAALYLKQFVGTQGTQGTKQLPWIHIDLYGLGSDGLGHAQGIRAMYNLIRNNFG
jgi:leucyl aminopeptidase